MTIDAMGMQKKIVNKIRQNEADDVIGLKGNRPTLATNMPQVRLGVQELIDRARQSGFDGFTTETHSTSEKARGCISQVFRPRRG